MSHFGGAKDGCNDLVRLQDGSTMATNGKHHAGALSSQLL